MLVLIRTPGEGLLIEDKITIEKINKSKTKIGIEAPKDVVVCREEVVRVINEENELSSA
ncbi:carbon storage regulator [Candidatus Scalindua japonica]|uniref:Translational regulator CsrA n=1 Tax=Candidatus Scalindua japonica TaxID=1284222 RepID=A0A286TTV8_9BACT|nr:carbon storage regulator [Candidatus Scalindua japonica]GAX59317.1 carbon storage regulator [Candidatus Scalindua japonica]